MKSMIRLLGLLLLGGWTLHASVLSVPAAAFSPVVDEHHAPFYLEWKNRHSSEPGAAIDTRQHQGRPAAAEWRYRGPDFSGSLELVAVGEQDGESRYHVAINGKALPERINERTTGSRVAMRHQWTGVRLREGDIVRVVFAGATNGLIPERGSTAWARGRWRVLELIPQEP